MDKKLRIFVVFLILAVLIASCTPAPAEEPAPVEEEPVAAEEEAAAPAEEEAEAPVDMDTTLIVYTNSGSDGRGDWLVERAAEAGFQIEYVHLGGGDLSNRLIAEKNNQIADLVFGLNAVEYEKLKKEDLLMQYEPVWASEVNMAYGDPEGYYYPIVVQPLLLVYNPEFVTPEEVPSDWTDLADPAYKDRYMILGLGGGTSRTILSSIAVRYADPAGTYGVSDEGWEVIKGYIQNAHIAVDGEDWWGNAISGERPMFMMWGSGYLQNEAELGVDFEFMTPEIGVPFVVEQVAVFKNSDNIDLALEFADWFGSAEIQSEWSAQFGSTPAHPDALANASPEVQALMAAVTPQEIDWGFVTENVDKWAEKCELEYVQ